MVDAFTAKKVEELRSELLRQLTSEESVAQPSSGNHAEI